MCNYSTKFVRPLEIVRYAPELKRKKNHFIRNSFEYKRGNVFVVRSSLGSSGDLKFFHELFQRVLNACVCVSIKKLK